MTSILNFDVVLISVVVFVVVMVLAHIHVLFERRASKAVDGGPLVPTIEPNRRNQSVTPPKVTAAKAIMEGGFVYRSVTPSKRNSGSRKALYRVEGLLIGIALFLAVFYLFGWFNP